MRKIKVKSTSTGHDLIETRSELAQLFQLTKIIKLRWGFLEYRIDFAAGLKLPPRIAGMQAKLQKSDSYPDITFLHPIGQYHGLLIEFKRDISEVYNKDGSMTTDIHIRKQWAFLLKMRALGYKAEWGFGVDHTLTVIEDYLGGK